MDPRHPEHEAGSGPETTPRSPDPTRDPTSARSPDGRLVAVTGAGGSLGRALVRELLAHNFRVRGLVRSDADAAALREAGAEPLRGDVRDRGSLAALVAGADGVCHLAAWMGGKGGREAAMAVNADGTRTLCEVAAAAGVRRLLLASSIAVYGPVRDGVVDEAHPLRDAGDPYGASKIAAEAAARRVADDEELELVILRPTMIYGPDSASWTTTPLGAIRRGLPVVIGSGEDLLDAVYVDDVARAFRLALDADGDGVVGEAFNVTGEATTWNRFFGAYAEMFDQPLRRLPGGLVEGGARAADAVTKLLTGKPRVNAEMLGVMRSGATFAGAKARDRLGYRPRVTLDEGMARVARWLRDQGQLGARTALVTGAGSGLGRAVVAELLREGLTVYASDVSEEALAGALADGARALPMDVTDDASVAAAAARVEADGARVDLVVNVAGINNPGALEAQPMDDVELQFQVNALGPLRVVRAFAPAMRAQGWGRVVTVSSTNGFMVTPFMGAYSASKYAVEALMDALRLELKPFGVEVVVVQPGAMKTPFAARAKEALQAEIDKHDAWSPFLARFRDSNLWGESTASEPSKVARVVVRQCLRPKPPARVHGTLDALPTKVMAMMPDGLKDRFFSQAAGLSKGAPKTGS